MRTHRVPFFLFSRIDNSTEGLGLKCYATLVDVRDAKFPKVYFCLCSRFPCVISTFALGFTFFLFASLAMLKVFPRKIFHNR